MAFNVKDAQDIFVGTGTLYIGGVDVGILQGDVNFKYEPTYKEIKAGSPARIVKKPLVEEASDISATGLEMNPDTIALLIPQFTKESVVASTPSVTDEYVGALVAGVYSLCDYKGFTNDAVTVKVASMITQAASIGDTVIHVADASLFTAGDSVTFTEGASTEEKEIATDGVDTGANTITLTVALAAAFSVAGYVVNDTTTCTENTDYFLDRIGGRITRKSTSTAIPENATVAISYTYSVISSTSLWFGGKQTITLTNVLFVSDSDDKDERWYIEYGQAQFTGAFNMDFKPGDPLLLNVKVEAVGDSSQVEGKQMGRVYKAAA